MSFTKEFLISDTAFATKLSVGEAVNKIQMLFNGKAPGSNGIPS